MRRPFIILLAAISGGCASTPKYDAELQPWVGRSQGELFAEWGAPSEVQTDVSGATVLLYHRERSWQKRGVSMGVGGTFPGGDQPIGADSGAKTIIHYCNTFFVLDAESRIVSYTYEGDECPLKPPPKRRNNYRTR